jgi:hypothetical protein
MASFRQQNQKPQGKTFDQKKFVSLPPTNQVKPQRQSKMGGKKQSR